MYDLSKRQRKELLRSQLEQERSSFIGHWRSITDLFMPRRARFTNTDANRGDRRNQQIIDSTATMALRTIRSGMMSGITSPARQWFRLSTPDPTLAEFGPVKDWLHTVTQLMHGEFLRSNYYNVKPMVYGDMAMVGTAPYSMEEDFDTSIRCYSFPIGSYMIAKDSKGRINTFVRDFRMTIAQVVEMFGTFDGKTGKPNWKNFSDYVKNAYERGNYQDWIDICQVIQPNEEYDPRRLHSKYKKYSSCYYERGNSTGNNLQSLMDDERYLRESGYDYFPVLCPRWEVTGEDVYGTDCPGMTALGDVKQLQWGEKKIAKAIDKMIDPPMTGPTALRNQKTSILPGDITYNDSRDEANRFRPAHEIQFRVDMAEAKQEQIRNRINKAFFVDLFLMFANDDRNERATAAEIAARQQEKLTVLGPVLEQVNQDDLDPGIDIMFDIMLRQGKIPQPPEEIQGMQLKVEYISVMAQAQKSVGISSLERFSGFVGQLAAVFPSVLQKVNSDQMVDEYGDAIGVSPKVIRGDEEVEEMRAAEAQAAQQAQLNEKIAQGAQTAKALSETDMESDNALVRLTDQLGQAQSS